MHLCSGHHENHDTYNRATCTCDVSMRMSDIMLLSTLNGARMNLKALWLKDQICLAKRGATLIVIRRDLRHSDLAVVFDLVLELESDADGIGNYVPALIGAPVHNLLSRSRSCPR